MDRVLQNYITPPLLLKQRKFHIRAYALAVGALHVYLNVDCLALCSGTRYSVNDTENLFAHITNTAFQDLDPNFSEEDCIYLWSPSIISPILVGDKTCKTLEEAQEKVEHTIEQMKAITGELFRAYESEFGVFSPIEGCFEHYGLDFVVDQNWTVYLLEVNPGPDFKQTRDRLGCVIEHLMVDTAKAALLPLVVRLQTDKQDTDDTQIKSRIGRLELVCTQQTRGSRSGGKPSMVVT